MPQEGFDDWVGRVYGARSNEELTRRYDAWAATYDRDVDSVGYRLPALAAGLFGRYVAPGAGEILDAGCVREAREVTAPFRPIPDSKTEGDIEARFFVYRLR